ncbi:(2Fe-2S)-binding protein [Streptomyces europaeiscabiei]|uniref:(2Fe-2S)-binding protein n=1 Tax=Streptomyces europaeiscabiei TaxID=146819 RepID=UPI0029A127CB|nr:(2Fe-2S)-binding protein [Streptomyces europaeiscabiei]MDX3612831.1 (2Fe-2S)-binding protein [Streptomyces europaeiscabiei]
MDHDPGLDALSALGGFFVLRTGEPPHGPLPTLAEAYAARDAHVEREVYANPVIFRVRKVARSVRAPEPRVAASIAHLGFAARLWSVALGAAALYGRVLDLDPGLLCWDADASAPDELWLTEVRSLPAERIGEVVRDGHLVPLAAALRAQLPVSERLLWGNAASALMGAVRQIDHWAAANGRTEEASRARELATELFAHPALAGTLDPVTYRRRSCCLYYRLPGGGLCGDCCFDRPPGPRPLDGRRRT